MLDTFNTRSACKLAGVTARQIDYWDRTHLVKPSVREASGYGSVRLYSFIDLVQLKLVKTLQVQGIGLQKIRKSASYLKRNFPAVTRPLAELRFLTDGHSIFVLTGDRRVIIDTLKKGQLVFSIGIGEMIEGLKGEVEALGKERKYEVKVGKKVFKVILHPDPEDGGYWVECPTLPGCASQGETVEDALEMIRDAIEGHLEVLAEDKRARKASA